MYEDLIIATIGFLVSLVLIIRSSTHIDGIVKNEKNSHWIVMIVILMRPLLPILVFILLLERQVILALVQ